MIDQQLLRKVLRAHIEKETEGNVSVWCRQGDHKFLQGTIAGFLAGHRDAGRDLLIRLCARMRLTPQNFYKSETPDVLKSRLALLSELVAHPEFPFGKEAEFEALAAYLETMYSHCLKDKK